VSHKIVVYHGSWERFYAHLSGLSSVFWQEFPKIMEPAKTTTKTGKNFNREVCAAGPALYPDWKSF
jgi:hypothetical protein